MGFYLSALARQPREHQSSQGLGGGGGGGRNVSRDKTRLGSTKECQGLPRGLGSFDGGVWAGRRGAQCFSTERGVSTRVWSQIDDTTLCMGNKMLSSQSKCQLPIEEVG